jgi:hypothetical protein
MTPALGLVLIVGCRPADETARGVDAADTVVTARQEMDTSIVTHDTTVEVDTTYREGDRPVGVDTVTGGSTAPMGTDTVQR